VTSVLAHRNDPDTSHIAAAALNSSDKAIIKAVIVDLLAKKPRAQFQLTAYYVKFRRAFGWPDCKPDSIAKRLSELVNDGLVVDTERRIQSPYSRPVAVWAAA
jgi:hypothetical protein